MPIPNVSSLYQRIHKGAEGGHEFARFIKMLLKSDYESRGINFISESDASGDYKKVDAYIPGDEDFPRLIKVFQFKFFPSKLSSRHKQEVLKSIELALKENEGITEFVLVTPEDLMKEDQEWFDSIRNKYEEDFTIYSNGLVRFLTRKISHWGHSKLVELSLKHEHLGREYFPELFPFGIGRFKLSKVSIDSTLCNWMPSEHGSNRFYQTQMEKDDQRTTDPVFDFRFKNSTSEIHLLNKIEIHIERVWSKLKGIPQAQFLKSVGTIERELDFTKPINTISFNDPMKFPSNEAMRFHLQLTDFTRRCPGNMTKLKFWFYFDEIVIPTDSFTLSF